MEGACLGRSSIDDKQVVIHSGLRSPSEPSLCLPACLPACLLVDTCIGLASMLCCNVHVHVEAVLQI